MAGFLKFFRGGASTEAGPSGGQERVQRRSNGLNELTRALSRLDGLCVLDLGPTSPANITHFANLGQRIYNEDVLFASRDSQFAIDTENGKSIDVDKFLAENLNYESEMFEAVLMWDMPDYLNEALVKPVVSRIHKITKPGGMLLAFFHTKDAGPDAPYHRYHIAGPDTLDMQRIMAPAPGREPAKLDPRNTHFRLQRVFNNRHIENLFHEFSSIKFFLGRDNIREVLIIR